MESIMELRALEKCPECGRRFISIYPLIKCVNHIDLEEVYWKEEVEDART